MTVCSSKRMIIFSFLISFVFCSVQGDGEFIIVRGPPSIEFKGDEPVDQGLISDICSASLGFTTRQESDWQGFRIIDPFNFAEGIVILYVEGISDLGASEFQKFQLENSRDEEYTWQAIKNEIVKRFPTENNTLLRFELGYNENDISDVKTVYLNKNEEEDAYFLQELKDLETYSYKEKKDGIPDLFWFVLKSLHNLNDLKGPNNPSIIEAKKKVNEALYKLGEVFDSAYDGRVLVGAIVSDAAHTRQTRSVMDETDRFKNVSDVNRAIQSNEDFPAIFNIILWFSVALILSLTSVCVFIASMDPGRDSIIYRMTSNRMKKDS